MLVSTHIMITKIVVFTCGIIFHCTLYKLNETADNTNIVHTCIHVDVSHNIMLSPSREVFHVAYT